MKRNRLKILGVIGDPISHSLSPIMHNAGLAALKLPYIYMPFRVTLEELPEFFSTLKKRGIYGLNVTIPHKQNVIPFLDSLSREARLMGAVNTILGQGKKLVGANTDGEGFISSLQQEADYEVKGKQVILLGAGGAARALGVALGINHAREVVILNRTAKNAFDLAVELDKKFKNTLFAAGPLHPIDPSHWNQADLLINATSLESRLSLPLNKLSSKAMVCDIVYTPLETPLLKKAKKIGLKIHPGWGMLLHQGMLSFELWTGKKAPYEVMKKALLEALSK